MSSPNFPAYRFVNLWRSCHRKKAYATEEEAQRAVDEMAHDPMTVYKCRYFDHYHRGHQR